MTRDERERLGDIAGAIETIRTHAVDTSAGERIKRDAILYNLVILGEAVKGTWRVLPNRHGRAQRDRRARPWSSGCRRQQAPRPDEALSELTLKGANRSD